MIYHLLPINDQKEHTETSTCNCFPKVEVLENGDMLIIHNSFDGREQVEKLVQDVFNNYN